MSAGKILLKYIQVSSPSIFPLLEVHRSGGAPQKSWIQDTSEHDTEGMDAIRPSPRAAGPASSRPAPVLTERRRKTWAGCSARALLFCNATPAARMQNCSQAIFCTETSEHIQKLFSKSPLNGVVKGCLFGGEPRRNLSAQSLL